MLKRLLGLETRAEPEGAASVELWVVVVGSRNSGKSAVVSSFLGSAYVSDLAGLGGGGRSSDTAASNGPRLDVCPVTFAVGPDHHVRADVHFLELPASLPLDQHPTLADMCARAHGCVAVVDFADRASVDTGKQWIGWVRDHASAMLPVVVLAHKADRSESSRLTTAQSTYLDRVKEQAAELVGVEGGGAGFWHPSSAKYGFRRRLDETLRTLLANALDYQRSQAPKPPRLVHGRPAVKRCGQTQTAPDPNRDRQRAIAAALSARRR